MGILATNPDNCSPRQVVSPSPALILPGGITRRGQSEARAAQASAPGLHPGLRTCAACGLAWGKGLPTCAPPHPCPLGPAHLGPGRASPWLPCPPHQLCARRRSPSLSEPPPHLSGEGGDSPSQRLVLSFDRLRRLACPGPSSIPLRRVGQLPAGSPGDGGAGGRGEAAAACERDTPHVLRGVATWTVTAP